VDTKLVEMTAASVRMVWSVSIGHASAVQRPRGLSALHSNRFALSHPAFIRDSG